jgi:hypothetical protein
VKIDRVGKSFDLGLEKGNLFSTSVFHVLSGITLEFITLYEK